MPDGGEPAASAAIPFDVAGARAAGYSDGEIANYVGGLTNFNTGAARKAGYADDEIINHLAVQPKVAAPEPPAPETSASGAFVRAAGEQVLPTAGGIAGAYPGAAAGAAIGSVAGPPGAVVGGLVGGLGGFWAGAKAVETVQQGIINRLPTSVQQAIGQDPETRQADEAQHPYATMAGGLAPSLLFLRPGAVEKAAENAPAIAKVMANPIAARVFGAGVNTSLEGIQEQQQGEGYDPVKLGISAASGALLNRETRLGKAVSGAGPAALGRLFPDRPNVQPRPTVDDVVNAPDLDTAINAANQVASGAGPETGAAATPGVPVDIADETSQLATGDSRALQQAALLKLFHNTGAGTVEHTPDGGYQFRTTNAAGAEITHPIEVWNPEEEPDPAAIPTATVDALREHYGQAGVDVVFYKDDGAIPFDGAVDRNQPDTIFLSSNPDRNIAQVAGHEFTHVLQTTTLPDGSSLGDLLNQQIAAGITPAGQRYAAKMFGPTAPSRATFPDDASHAAAVQAHLINELGTDIGGEAPKFQSFLPRVVDAIQARFGDTVAGDVLGKLLDGLKAAMETVRGLFGESGTRSQHWVTNIGEIHDTLAQMYAARFGTPVEREQAALAAMRDKAQRDQFVAPEPAPEAPEAPADKTADTGRQAAPATDLWGETRDAQTAKALQLRRWLDQLAAERDAQAAATPRARLLTQTEAAIVRPVGGDETALPPDSKTRLDQVRQQLDEVAHPQADTPEMAKVRDELGATEEALSVAAEPEQPADVARTERRPQFTSEDRDGLLQLPNGQTELGRVPEGLSVPAGSIELRHGWHNEGTNRGTGLLHIEARHGAEIRAAGFHDAAQFVAEVAANYNEIRQDPNGRLFLVQRDMARVRSGDPQAALIVGLVRDGGGWRVETAGRFKSSYINKREMLWQAVHTAAPQPDGMAAPSSAPPTQVSVSEGRLSARDQSEPRLGATQDDVNSHLSDSAAPPGTTPATANALHAKVISQLRADSALQKVLAGDQERGSDQGALETVRKAYRAALGKMLADLAQTDMPALSRFAAAADELRDRAIGTDTVREAREPPKPERPADYGANNKMFTAEAADKAREVLRAKFARLNAGFDPEMMSAGFQLAGFHIEAGARRFSNYARAMTEDLGEGVRPYLAHFYNSVRDFPGFDNAHMDDAAAVKRLHEAAREPDKAQEAAAPSESLVPAPPSHPEPVPVSPHARAAERDHALAESIARRLEQPMAEGIIPLSARELQSLAESTYGGTLASGAYSRDRLYDALELGVNRFIQRHPERFNPTFDAIRAEAAARELAALKESLPTQTVRAGEKNAYQQFSTPPDYAYAANWVANLRPDDHVLEPSAGVGGLIVHAMNAGVRETTVNELSDKRRGMIAALNPTRATGEDAAQLHNILPEAVRPTVVVMNPPFSRAAERMGGKMVLDEGAKHIEQALARLEPGGRLVAIVGDSMKPEGTEKIGTGRGGTGKAFREWWQKIGAEYDVRANVGVDRDIYTKYGTSFPTRVLVIDKNPPSGRPMLTGQVRDAAGLIERLKDVRDERGAVESVAGQSGRPEMAEGGEGLAGPGGELHSPTGELGAGEGDRGDTAAGVTVPAGASQPGVRGGRPARSGTAEGGTGEPVVPVQSKPGRGRAGGKPRGRTGAGDDAGGGRTDSGGDGVRPDGSGERDDPGLTPPPEAVLATENAVASPDTAPVNEAVYEAYTPQRVQITGAQKHPGALVQSAAMATVMPPATDYKPRIPALLVKSGALSDAQLEAIVYAGYAHSDVMANGKRRGFFIGDGTGVGKGREIAGIILDNFQNGRTKAVWISEKRALVNDARRDWNGMGHPATDVIDHGKLKPGDAIKETKGILFSSYDTLKSAEQTKTKDGKVRGKERVDQIIEWLGKDFDGVIAFDEAHAMGNSTDTKGGRGIKKAAQKALAGIRLQEELPNARVIYVSATGATEVSNLAYAHRLGLWGEGTAFPTREDFIGQVSSGGIAGMELVARDMKALGHYIARNLSYDGVDYDRVEHTLTADQRNIYDKMAEGWQLVLQHFNAALEATGATDEDGKTKNSRAKSAVMSAFWGGHQRFFNQIITSMQMPSVIRGVEADLKAGRQAVLQLVNTMEAAQERALEKARASGEGDLDDLDMTPRDQLMQMVEKSYPIQQMEDYVDDNGNERSRPAVDSAGNPVINKAAVAARDRLLDELGSLRVPDGPLEMLLNHFGPDKVAEVTGRKQRVVRKPDDSGEMKTQVELRGAGANVADASAFQGGKKPILVFSEAGGTGRSYHAENGSGSEDARRSHYLVQGGWRADKAVQGFGRTHRTNQASAPIFHLVTTDLQGQKRFISSIARRLSQLGALTKGERRAADQGMFGMRDNLESTEARDGLIQFFKDTAAGQVEGVSMDDLEKSMGLKMRDKNGALASPLPEMSQFLNRVLSLTVDHQNRVFNAFSDRMDQAIARASAAGTLDTGVETYQADKISKLSEQTVYTDPRSGAETKHVHLNAQNRNEPISFEETLAGRNKTNGAKPDTFIQNNRSGRVFAVTPGGNYTDADGRIIPQARLTSPIDYQLVDREKVDRDNWKRLTPEQAKPLWDQQVAATPEFRNSALHIITGAVLPIWDRLGGSPKIFRLATDQGERMLGRVIPATQVDATLRALGAEGIKVTAGPAEIAQRVLNGATARLANDWTIKRSLVAGEPRLELVGPDYRYGDELGRNGVFSERIAYTTRFFIPTEPAAAAAAIEGITKTRPVTALEGGAQFSPRVQFSPRPVADVRGDELGGEDKSYGYRRTRGREALLAVMKQGPVENPQLGTVQFSGAGVGRTLRTFDSAKLALIPHLREIIAEGDLVRSAPSYKPDPNVRAYHTLEAPVRIGGVDHDARVVIREDNNGKFYYDIEKTEAPLVRRDVSPDRDQTLTQPASTEPLPRDVGGEPDSVNLDLDAGGADRPGKAVPAAGTVVDSGERSAPDVDLNLTQLPGDRSGSAPDDGLPLFSPRQRVAVYNERETEAWTPEQALAYSHVGRVVEVPTFRERLATLTNDLGRRTIRYLVDPYIGVKADDPAGYMALRNANTTAGATEMFLTDGTLRFNGSTYAMADRNGGVEHSLVRPLHGEQDRFLWWVAANRAERLTAEDRENLWSQDDIDTLKATNQGQVPFDYTLPNGQVTRSRKAIYLDSLRKLDGFNKNVLDLAEQSGLIGSDTVSELVANPFYVPFYRLAEDDGHFAGPNLTSGFVKQNAFKTLKGGTQKLNNDLWDNAIKNWSHMIDASLRNKAASGVLDTAVTNGAAIERSERELAYLTKADKKSTVWVMNNGRKQSFQISDPMLFTAISALEFNGIHNWAMDIMTKFKTILTQGVTADPRFMLRICIRDAEQAIATAPLSLNVAKNVYTGFGMGDLPGALTNVARAVAGQQLRRLAIGQEAADAIAGGATMRLGSGHDTGGRTTDLDTMLDSPKSIAKFWHWVSQIARAYKEVTAQGEDTQRFALYHKLIADGVPHDQASFAARDLEDFTLKGAGQIVRFLTQTVPFMNAWMQGLYKVGRSTFDQDRNFAVPVGKRLAASATKRVGIVLAASTLATLALDALYADDEDYKKRPEYDRNANFWFKFGGVQFRIPMGFEIAAIGRIAANGVEAFFGQNEMTGRRFVNNVGSIFMANMSMNPVPQIVRPLLDVYSNTSGTGAPIIGKGMDRLRSEEQYTAATTMPARWASSAANTAARAIGGPQAKFLAPIQIDYLVNGYFGWLGSHVVNLADIALRGADQAQAALRGGQPFEPVRPNTDLWNFATGGMVSTETTPQSRYVDMLYQQADGISRAYATYEDLIARGRVDDARDFYAANKHQIGKHQLIDKIEQVEQMANRQIKRTGESQTLSAEQKRIEIMKYNAMRNRAAENVFGTRPASAP